METIERILKLEQRVAKLESSQLTTLSGFSTWTPTSPAGSWTNIDSVTFPTDGNYLRYSNFVFCFGKVSIDPTAAGSTLTEFDVTLPITASFANEGDLFGACLRNSANTPAATGRANTVDDRATFRFLSTHAAAVDYYYFMIYKIS